MIEKTTFTKNKTKAKPSENSATTTTATKGENAMWLPVFKEPLLSITEAFARGIGCVETSSKFYSWFSLNEAN